MRKEGKSKEALLAGSESLHTRLQRDLKDAEFREAFEAHYLEAIVAEKVHELRMKRHLSQKQLAEKAGMMQHAVSRIEKGENSLTLRTVQRIAAAMGYMVEVEFKPMKRRRLAIA